MIVGVGIDLCSIKRMKLKSQSDAFCARVFTENERGYAFSRSRPHETLAAMFAAKEACAKATGLGLGRLGLKNVELDHTSRGSPVLVIKSSVRLPERLRHVKTHVSLSHDGDYAIAFVVLEE